MSFENKISFTLNKNKYGSSWHINMLIVHISELDLLLSKNSILQTQYVDYSCFVPNEPFSNKWDVQFKVIFGVFTC